MSVSGYLITSREANEAAAARRPSTRGGTSTTSPPNAAGRRWRTDSSARLDPARLGDASRTWKFDDATFERTAAAFDNPDYAAIVIHNYRWRLGLADGERRYDSLERRLAARPVIRVPTITLDADADPFTAPEPARLPRRSPARTAPHDPARHRPQPAAGGAARLRPGRVDADHL